MMHKFPDIPVVEIGPGSQPQDEYGALDYLAMPSGMETYHQPILPEAEDEQDLAAGKQALEAVLAALTAWQPSQPVRAIDLTGLDAPNLDFVNQALGEGEVSVALDGPAPIQAQESVLAGVWRVRHFDAHQRIVRDMVEVGDVPDMVRSATFADADTELETDVEPTNPAVQNAPALLIELADKLEHYQPGDSAHTLNLTLLPLTEADVILLGERLGVGPVTILSRGYGNCRIGSTAKRNAWWIKYFNSQDVLILKSDEWLDLPERSIQTQVFPSGRYEFIVSAKSEIGRYQACSLLSPVLEIDSQDTAFDVALAALQAIDDPDFRDAESNTQATEVARRWHGEAPDEGNSDADALSLKEHLTNTPLSRRDVLRGRFLKPDAGESR